MEALDRLLNHIGRKFGFITPDQAAAWLTGSRSRFEGGLNSPYLITFDDGFQSNAKAAREILAAHQAKALFFVCPGLVDLLPGAQAEAVSRHVFEGRTTPEDLPQGMELMTWGDIAALADDGHSIGAHGMLHQRLTNLNEAQSRAEISGAGAALDERLDQSTNWYAYAFGDIESISSNCLAGILNRHQFCRSGVRGVNTAGSRVLFAEQIDLESPFTYQKLIADGGLDFLYAGARRQLERMMPAGNS